jgi:uncharacterized protein (TIRG00374 family)
MNEPPAQDAAPSPPRPWWRQPLVWFGFALSALAIGTFIYLFDMQQVMRSLIRVRWTHVAASVVIFLAAFMVRSLRWKLLLTPLGRYPFGKVRDVLIIGYMANLLLPARLGEVARAMALWKVTGASRRGGLTTIGLARLFDGCFLLALLVALGLLFELPPWARSVTSVLVVLMAIVLVLALWLAFHERSLFWLMERLLFFLPGRLRERVVGFFRRFAAGTHALRRPGLVGGCLLATVVIWSLEFCVYLTMMRGFDIALPVWSALLAMAMTNIGIAAPSAPGFVGVFEAACSGAVIALGLDKELGLSYAIGVHIMMYVTLVVTGQILMYRLGLRLSDLTGPQAASSPTVSSPEDLSGRPPAPG